MSTSDEMNAFLREGLRRYVDAREAVDAFEREIEDSLARVFEEKRDWKNFEAKRGERGRGKAISSGAWSGSIGRTIWSTQAHAAPEEGWIDLGLWWRSPRARDGVLAFCSRWDPGYRQRSISLSDPKGPVVCSPIDGNKSRLYVVFGDELDLNATGRLLLDEMDRALAATTSPNANG